MVVITADLEFNNVNCLTHDKKYLEFEYCYLKSVNRTYKYFSLKAVVHQLPVQNAMVAFKLIKRDTRNIFEKYKGFVNACKFLKEGQNPIARIIFNTFAAYANVNHTCPFNHALILEKLPVQHVNNVVKNFIPEGRYLLNLTFYNDNISRTDILVYFTKA
ncbi:uncharacterized protein LOC115483380 [Drosophila hydei]|uniref:Uncharacterized protein LOC115483380 n=1 Tax=Drosophila hydei TaxID=7224 RepID=A0A6J2SUY3_DROHY|nr:uncharacterized protein LOC115483380 [Drosophila hydei]